MKKVALIISLAARIMLPSVLILRKSWELVKIKKINRLIKVVLEEVKAS